MPAGPYPRQIERYLTLKSIGALVADLRSLGITSRGGGFFGVGALAHLLRNRFYIGEVVYRGEVHPGAQERQPSCAWLLM